MPQMVAYMLSSAVGGDPNTRTRDGGRTSLHVVCAFPSTRLVGPSCVHSQHCPLPPSPPAPLPGWRAARGDRVIARRSPCCRLYDRHCCSDTLGHCPPLGPLNPSSPLFCHSTRDMDNRLAVLNMLLTWSGPSGPTDANAVDFEGDTALHVAAAVGSRRLITVSDSVLLCLSMSCASVPLCLCASVPLCLCASVPVCLCASVSGYEHRRWRVRVPFYLVGMDGTPCLPLGSLALRLPPPPPRPLSHQPEPPPALAPLGDRRLRVRFELSW
jgi:hypothetical protein